MDLVALNIQRGRDHGLPDYNTLRESFGLVRKNTFTDITNDPVVQASLGQVYNSVDEVDPWVGALAETHVPGASVGELLGRILSQQFLALMNGDPVFYLADVDLQRVLGGWHDIVNLDDITLADVIRETTSLSGVHGNVFFV